MFDVSKPSLVVRVQFVDRGILGSSRVCQSLELSKTEDVHRGLSSNIGNPPQLLHLKLCLFSCRGQQRTEAGYQHIASLYIFQMESSLSVGICVVLTVLGEHYIQNICSTDVNNTYNYHKQLVSVRQYC